MYYDPRGQVIRTVNPDNTEQRVVYGKPVTLSEVEGFSPSPWETYSYDANDLDATNDHYATPKSAEVDALGRTIKTLDRLESTDSTSNNVQMLYEYDIRGNLLNVKDAYDRTVFEHVYDLQTPAKEGESIPPLKTTHINKGTSIVVFDCTGKPVETRDAKDALTLHAYDTLHRPYAIWTRDNGGESATLRLVSIYGTDEGTNSNGKIYQQFDEAGFQQINSYDFKGNVIEKYNQVISDNEILNTISTWSGSGWGMNPAPCYRVDWGSSSGPNIALLDGRQYQTNMEYDGLNRLKKITYPADADNNRKELIPLYNKAGALQKVQFDGTDFVKEIAYNAKGQRLLIAYGNGLMTRYTYNEQTFRLTRLKTEGFTYTNTGDEHLYEYNSGTTKQDFAYTYDKGGNILSINDETPSGGVSGGDGLERTFEYDALYRLLAASGRENTPSSLFWNDTSRSDDPHSTSAYTQNYEYDLMGNISELAHSGSSGFTRDFSYTDNLLNNITVGGNTYTFNYDICGNQIQENTERFFQWDYADRMRLYYNQAGMGTEPSVITHYLYDAGGNRVKKLTRVAGGNWESLTYIDGLIEYREDNTGQKQSISHIMDDSKRIASTRKGSDFGDTTPEIKYNLDDHLGSSNLSVDENGTLINREEYYPFGETSFGSYSKKRYRFCGKEKDEESGLYYYGARYYSPWTCRFISVDPQAGKYIFQTPYAYADNNPICKMDYNGEGTDGESGNGKPQENTANSLDGSKIYNLDEKGTWDYKVWNDKKKTYIAHKINAKDGLTFDEQDTINTRNAIKGENKVVEEAYNRAKKVFQDTNVPINDQMRSINGAIAKAKAEYWGNIFAGNAVSKIGDTTISMPRGGPVLGVNVKANFATGRVELNNIVFDAILTFASFGGYAAVRGAMEAGWRGLSSLGARNAVKEGLVRVRHHTSSSSLKGIKNSGSINASRGKPYGVDVEVAPFLKPTNVNLGQAGQGSFIEFSVPKSQLITPPGFMGGVGNAGRIVTGGAPLNLTGTAPKFVKWNWLGF